MKRSLCLVLFAGLVSATYLEARGRGGSHHGSHGGGLAPFRHPGAVIGHGLRGHGVGRPGAFGYGVGRPGPPLRWSWPLFGSGFGIYYSEYNAPLQLQDYDTVPDSNRSDLPSVYYYQKPAKPDAMPNCKDTWATQGSSSSLGNFMNRVFELQCQNRHPEAETKPPQAVEPAKN
jgi:hypothetical protein